VLAVLTCVSELAALQGMLGLVVKVEVGDGWADGGKSCAGSHHMLDVKPLLVSSPSHCTPA
jgi:hypothetical protein